jgi:hypothetical protein
MKFNGIAFPFHRRGTDVYHDIQELVDCFLVSMELSRSDRQAEAAVNSEE